MNCYDYPMLWDVIVIVFGAIIMSLAGVMWEVYVIEPYNNKKDK